MGAPVGAPARNQDCKLLKELVGERGFEPPTPWSRTRCSTRLSHSPTQRAGESQQRNARFGVFSIAASWTVLRASEILSLQLTSAVHRQICIFMTQDKRPQPNEFGEFAYLCSGCEVWFFSVRPPEKQPN